MSNLRRIKERTERRKVRVRTRLRKESSLPRVSVFRSLSHIYAQIIDDAQQKTLVSCSSLELENVAGDKKAIALAVGKELAARAKKQGIEKVSFDRGAYLYHGRVKNLAQGMRDAGIQL